MLSVIGVRAGGEGQGKEDPMAALRSQWGELIFFVSFLDHRNYSECGLLSREERRSEAIA